MNGFNYYCIDGTRMNEIITLVFIMSVVAIIIAIFLVFLGFVSYNYEMIISGIIIAIVTGACYIFTLIIIVNKNDTYKIESDRKIETDIRNHFSENVDITYDKDSQSGIQKKGIILSSDCTYEFIVDYDEDKITIYPINENNNKESIIIYGNK